MVSIKQQDINAGINLALLDRNDNNEFIDCKSISYYVDGEEQFSSSGQIMINRRDNYPKLTILSPDTGIYTSDFQENSCVYTDLGNLDAMWVETTYSPKAIKKTVNVKVIIVF